MSSAPGVRRYLNRVNMFVPCRKHEALAGASMSARHPEAKGKWWIMKKKDNMRRKGYDNVPGDSKYTGRKRKARF